MVNPYFPLNLSFGYNFKQKLVQIYRLYKILIKNFSKFYRLYTNDKGHTIIPGVGRHKYDDIPINTPKITLLHRRKLVN